MNNVTLIGNLGSDPVLRHTPSGNPVLNFSLAVDRRSYTTNENGTRAAVTTVDWIPVVIWNSKAEACAKYLQKGSKVAVHGSLRQRSYETAEGTKVNVLEVKAIDVSFLSKIKSNEQQG